MSQVQERKSPEFVSCNLFTNVGRFHDKYFSGTGLTSHTVKVPSLVSHIGATDVSAISSECLTKHAFLSWLDKLQLAGDLQWKHVEDRESDSVTVALCQCDDASSRNHARSFVRVIGVQSSSQLKSYSRSFMQLYEKASAVFEEDPTRLFLHGFLLRRATIEYWIFDRAGAYCSTPIDVLKFPTRLLNAMNAYMHHTETELGANPLVRQVNGRISILNDHICKSESEGPLDLDAQPLADSEELIGAGLTVYLAQNPRLTDQHLVVKFKWKEDREQSEGFMLRLIRDRQVQGVMQFYHYEEITSTDAMRKGLMFGKPQRLEVSIRSVLPNITSAPASDTATPVPSLSMDNDSTMGMQDYLAMTNVIDRGEPYENRSLSCIVVYPFGKPLHEFDDPKQAIQGLRDALAGHRSLYQQGGILHRDISIFNILLTARSSSSLMTEDCPKGFLIDLDFASDLSIPRTRNSFYGTPPFMGIRALQSREQTYRQDLESFLYTFIWFAVSPRSARLMENIKLQHWREADYDQLAQIKLEEMTNTGFEKLLEKFDSNFVNFRDLARNLRVALFVREKTNDDGTGENERLWTGTDDTLEGTNLLYDKMLAAFDEAIRIT